VVLWLSGAGAAMVVLADVSLMSKAEVERIWLPFVPWLLLSCALLPERWRRGGLVLQVALALVVQHLLDTGW
jgi:methylthioxylose transferase